MLNIAITSPIKSSMDNLLSPTDTNSFEAQESAGDLFGKILEREVSEANQSDTKNRDQKKNDTTATSLDDDTNQAAEVPTNPVDQNITNETHVDSVNASTKSSEIIANLGAAVTLPEVDINTPIGVAAINAINSAQTPPSMLMMSKSDNQLPGAALSMVNQLLQQTLMQQNLQDSNLTAIASSLAQSLEQENSAAFDKFLPLAELGNSVQNNLNDLSFGSRHDIATQSHGLTGTMSAQLQDTPVEKVHVSTPIGHAKWGGELAQKLVWMTSQQSQIAEIHLNPAHLGPVEVMLSISQDQATAQFVSAHPAVRDAIQDALPRLREILAENGIQLGNVTVGAESFQQDNRQQQAYQQERGASAVLADSHTSASESADVLLQPTRHHGIVNTYA